MIGILEGILPCFHPSLLLSYGLLKLLFGCVIGFCLGLLVLLCLLGFFESLVLLERTIFKGLKIFDLFFKICFDCYEVCCLF